ncbi:Leucine-rich repeat protein kinase family protein [Euphorbia peplus]|nr:Leucine-rich repeat protein kinase family protein [Euphorbia peplus]
MNLLSSFILVLVTLFQARPPLIFSADALIRGNDTDYEALLSIKSRITDVPDGVLSSWNSSVQFCNWIGITCGRRHRRVTKITLTSKATIGSLSPLVEI